MYQIARDLAFAVRLLRRAPGFAVVGTLVVALGVGATTAIFSVVYAVMLRPPAFVEADRLVALWSRQPDAIERTRVNPADQRDLRAGNTVFEDIGLANAPQNFNLLGSAEPERVVAARLSHNLLSILRVTPALGRAFMPEDEQGGRNRVVLLGDGLWKRRFGADPSIVGRTINLSGVAFEVVGVMPPGFYFPEREHQLWIPLTINPRVLAREIATHDHLAVARLKPGVEIAQARREVDALAARLAAQYPQTNRSVRIELLSLFEESVRPVRPALYVMLGAVLSLLLVACLNLGGLLGARAASRTREFTVRRALGASRGRLMRQALAEVTPILALGGVAGVAGAQFAVAGFVPMAPAALPRAESIAINGPVLGFSLIILVVTGLGAALLPALHAWRVGTATVTPATRGGTGTAGQVRARSALVVAQLALTLPLLVGAAALARSFTALLQVEPGFRSENVLSLHLAVPRTKYPTDAQIADFYSRIVNRVAAVPGVISVGMVNRLPMSGNDLRLAAGFDGVTTPAISLQSRSVTPDYFQTMRIPLREGRLFTEADGVGAPLVAIVDERLARALWPGATALGKRYRVALPGQAPAWGEIVGVVGNVRHRGLDHQDDRQIYFNYRQFTDGRSALVVRSRIETRAIAPGVRQAIQSVDPDQPAYDVRTMDDVLAASVSQRWLNMTIIGVFAASALLLASIGLYGVIAYGVTERLREFGVRLALGAAPSAVAWMVLRKASILAASGIALGLTGAAALTRVMQSLLYGVRPLDPISFVAAVVLVFGIALLASYVPARRAAAADPAACLRAE